MNWREFVLRRSQLEAPPDAGQWRGERHRSTIRKTKVVFGEEVHWRNSLRDGR